MHTYITQISHFHYILFKLIFLFSHSNIIHMYVSLFDHMMHIQLDNTNNGPISYYNVQNDNSYN
jgi:hypothetical protein